MSDEKTRLDRVIETKKQIAERNKNNKAINSHAMITGGVIRLVVVYENGTYDKHTVNFEKPISKSGESENG